MVIRVLDCPFWLLCLDVGVLPSGELLVGDHERAVGLGSALGHCVEVVASGCLQRLYAADERAFVASLFRRHHFGRHYVEHFVGKRQEGHLFALGGSYVVEIRGGLRHAVDLAGSRTGDLLVFKHELPFSLFVDAPYAQEVSVGSVHGLPVGLERGLGEVGVAFEGRGVHERLERIYLHVVHIEVPGHACGIDVAEAGRAAFLEYGAVCGPFVGDCGELHRIVEFVPGGPPVACFAGLYHQLEDFRISACLCAELDHERAVVGRKVHHGGYDVSLRIAGGKHEACRAACRIGVAYAPFEVAVYEFGLHVVPYILVFGIVPFVVEDCLGVRLLFGAGGQEREVLLDQEREVAVFGYLLDAASGHSERAHHAVAGVFVCESCGLVPGGFSVSLEGRVIFRHACSQGAECRGGWHCQQ